MTGLTVSSVTRTSNTAAQLTFAYTGTDFDTDGSFTITVAIAGHSGSSALTQHQ